MTTDSRYRKMDAPSICENVDVLLLTGMHRSGTSFLAKRFHDAGIPFPGDLLPANADNPEGYWEAREVVQLNNRILQSVGSDWRDHSEISDRRMRSLIEDFSADASSVLSKLRTDAGGRRFALKDPRLCRLLPVWLAAADALGLSHKVFATVRRPDEVAQSLFRRTHEPRFSPAAVANPTKALWLWLRYNLDLVAHSHEAEARLIDFAMLRGLNLAELSRDKHIDGSYDAYARPPQSWRELAERVYQTLSRGLPVQPNAEIQHAISWLKLAATASSGRELDGPVFGMEAVFRGETTVEPPVRIGFLSGSPLSKGHIYRIENRIGASIGTDWITFRVTPEADDIDQISDACDVLIVFRKEMDLWLDGLYEACAKKGVPIIYDIDDLVFDPDYMIPKTARFLSKLSTEDRNAWLSRSHAYRESLRRADAVFLPTQYLADRTQKFNPITAVVSNGLSEARIRRANAVEKVNSSEVVIGYASGTATHDKDFATIAPALVEVLASNPNARLMLLGPLDGEGIALLDPYEKQIQRAGLVPFHELPQAVAEFDINIAPLELENPFCEGKSELKYFEAAIVGVPTIASKTKSYEAAIVHEDTGLLADDMKSWKQSMDTLISNEALRREMGARAREHAVKNYGPEAQGDAFAKAIKDVIQRHTAPHVRDQAGFSLIEILVALAIAALVSMLIFGSLRQQYQLIDRVQNASAESLDLQARSRLLSNVIDNTVPAWPEAEGEKFVGNEDRMTGVTGETIFGDQFALRPYSVELVENGEVRTIKLETDEGVWELGRVPRDAKFEYYGHDGVWYENWPPENKPPSNMEEMAAQAAIGNLPALLRVTSDNSILSEPWVFSIYSTDGLGLRSTDFIGPMSNEFE